MAVRRGYKQTEVGVIPADWEVKKIRSVCKLVNGRGFKPFEWKKTGLPIIRIQNLNGSDEYNCYEGSYDKKLEIEAGQLLFAWSGSRGTSFGPHVWSGPRGLLNYHTWKVNVSESEIDHIFFFHALKNLTAFIEDKAHGAAALVHTQKWEMEGFEFPVPPSKNEQRAIAAALSDVDALLAKLDQLIAKKRDLKQAAMQQLLTGQTRLPGFTDEWEVKSLETLFNVSSGGGEELIERDQGKYFIIEMGSISEDGKLLINKKTNSDRSRLFIGDLVMPTRDIGEGKIIGKVAIINKEDTYVLGNNVYRLSAKDSLIDAVLFYYLINSKPVNIALKKKVAKSVQLALNKSHVEKQDVSFPPTKIEQIAIATILSALDAEIASLETRRAKTHALKQGMMQELLTGRIRLL